MSPGDLTIGMVGSGGDGVVTMGGLLALAAAREGRNVIKTEGYGPQMPRETGEVSSVSRILEALTPAF